jgi:hypothetical protein
VNQSNRHRVEEVQLFPPGPLRDDQARAFQHAQVFHHAEACHLELGFELAERAPVARKQQVEQEPPRAISQRLKHAIVVDHAGQYM